MEEVCFPVFDTDDTTSKGKMVITQAVTVGRLADN